jgi:taurine--2-oxoglutarate transaminase
MISERDSVFHSWCVPAFAVRGNLIFLAPPLVIEERELSDALALLDRLLSEMESV